MQLIGDTTVAGLSPSEATNLLKKKYDELYQKDLNSQYTLRTEDVIDIKLFYNPELNETVRIRPDGMVSLSLIGDIRAHGKTTAELAANIKGKYRGILQKHEVIAILRETKRMVVFPELTIVLKSNKGQPVYVGGEVASPGLLVLESIITTADAIIKAGGLKNTASAKDILIISRSKEKKITTRTVDMDRLFKGLGGSENPILKPYDIVYVPKSTIAELNLFVEQYLRNMIPFNMSFGFFYRFD
jgi:protein involved in polysaccharide export with SLBB domain